jgi:hypothetical protein
MRNWPYENGGDPHDQSFPDATGGTTIPHTLSPLVSPLAPASGCSLPLHETSNDGQPGQKRYEPQFASRLRSYQCGKRAHHLDLSALQESNWQPYAFQPENG